MALCVTNGNTKKSQLFKVLYFQVLRHKGVQSYCLLALIKPSVAYEGEIIRSYLRLLASVQIENLLMFWLITMIKEIVVLERVE
jgi:hypothetical protein